MPWLTDEGIIDPALWTVEILQSLAEARAAKICTVTPFSVKGNKRRLVRRIIPHLPEKATTYVEPFAGSAAVFFAIGQRYPVNILNDLDGDIVNVFRVLQNPVSFRLLAHRLMWTPHALSEYLLATLTGREAVGSAIDRAWAFIVGNSQAFQTTTIRGSVGNWARSYTSSFRWYSQVRGPWLLYFHEVLQGVFIECQDALDLIAAADKPDTVFFIDPPYLNASSGYYRYTMPAPRHTELVDLLLTVKGHVVLTTYPSDVYQRLIDAGWKCEVVGADRGCHSRSGNRNKQTSEWILVKHAESQN